MIAIIDPALLLPREEDQITSDLKWITRYCRDFGIRIVAFEEYWIPLWSTLARPLELSVGNEAKSALRELRRLAVESKGTTWELPSKVWKLGFTQLFSIEGLGGDWEARIAASLLRALTEDPSVVILTRRMEGRNLRTHRAGEVTLEENTRWVLHLSMKNLGHKKVMCMYSPRNLQENWTTRFDWRLPAASDKGKFPFSPADDWWKPSRAAVRTVSGKPCWIDIRNNGWARPNIRGGVGDHWDVYIYNQNDKESIGLNQINVVQFPCHDKTPGDIHHVPTEKAGRLNL